MKKFIYHTLRFIWFCIAIVSFIIGIPLLAIAALGGIFWLGLNVSGWFFLTYFFIVMLCLYLHSIDPSMRGDSSCF